MAPTESKRNQLLTGLRNLYESLGYTRFSMRRFEEYGLYLENKSFLKSENVLTFTNPDGKLMALKPDVTLSIVKHARREREGMERVYYQESVYSYSAVNREVTEIEQMGVEAMGDVDAYVVSEVVRLAVESLKRIGLPYVLDVSHMGFTAGLMDGAGLTPEQQAETLSLVRRKNAHELEAYLKDQRIAPDPAKRIVLMTKLAGPFSQVFPAAQNLSTNEQTATALDELRVLYDTLDGAAGAIRLDLSMLNELDYYNGIVFQGYVQGAPRAVLSGGRYDLLMRRFGKNADGIGFAVYLDELSRTLSDRRALDADALVLYRDGDDLKALHQAVFDLAAQGLRVIARKGVSAGDLKVGKALRFANGALREVR
ncbi:MAG: ATP phosphoribosyltransferase regulatory subunit [Clostridiales bacterium]|nr:ATP phosphoribosyltransferase regulatory subunit [Clostridiales bacterium]